MCSGSFRGVTAWLDDGEDITHIPFRAGEAGRVELWPLVEPEEGENKDVWLPSMERVRVESTSSRLAGQIAGRIKQMVESGQELKSQKRPVRYKDFMILVQRRNRFVEELVRACKMPALILPAWTRLSFWNRLQYRIWFRSASFCCCRQMT